MYFFRERIKPNEGCQMREVGRLREDSNPRPYPLGQSRFEMAAELFQPQGIIMNHRKSKNLRNLFLKPKEQVKPVETINVIHRVECVKYDEFCIGQIRISVSARMREYKLDTGRHDLLSLTSVYEDQERRVRSG